MGAISGDWLRILAPEFKKTYYRDLYEFVQKEYRTATIFPPAEDIFNALHYTDYDKVKVVILGQDPYHNDNQAHGLAFSVQKGQPIPPSLRNIYQELKDETGFVPPAHGNLEEWARQGVLLLNTVLTVRAHQAFSHKGRGWEMFTDAILRAVNQKTSPVVYLLWGSPAGQKATMLDNPNHLILRTVHPSPLSAQRGFFGCGHFLAANEFLKKRGETPIDWQIRP